MPRLAVLLVATLLLASCGSESARRVTSGEISEPEALTFRGELVWGHEARSFTECGESEASWVVDQTGGEVRAIYEQLASEPYQKLFVEIRGRRGQRLETGFAADYSDSIAIIEVSRAALEGLGCDDDISGYALEGDGVHR